jgi:hypothetical protein
MHRAYMGGCCNIEATGSVNSKGGLFCERNPLEIESTDVEIRWEPFEGDLYDC